MPSYTDVGSYLETNQLESELSEAVAACVDDEIPQPLPYLSDALRQRAAEVAVDWDYNALTDEIRRLIAEKKGAGALFMKLSFNDAATFSAALGDGGANAALRFTDGGEGTFPCNAGLAQAAVPLLEPLKARYPNISRADLWAHAANVALEALGGPKVLTRFGRRDAASSEDSVDSWEDRLVDEAGISDSGDRPASLRRVYHHKGLTDRELVALQGRKTVGECVLERSAQSDGPWTRDPHAFDNEYFTLLLRGEYEPAASASGVTILRERGAQTVMTPMDMALLEDRKLRGWVERFADDPKKFASEFALAWAKLQELGCRAGMLALHPDSLTYASPGCYIPNEWLELPLATRREVNHDTTCYGFKLPAGQQLDVPVCGYVLVKAPGRGKGPRDGAKSGKDEADGSDAVRPYVPISAPSMKGRFELLVKRYEGGAVSQYLHGLPLGARVSFRHTRVCVKAQYPFEGRGSFTMLCCGAAITPMYQMLQKILPEGKRRRVVLIYGSKTVEDILLKDELEAMARTYGIERLTLVFVVGTSATSPPPEGWKSSEHKPYICESGWVDEEKVAKYAHRPESDPSTMVFVAGLPAFYAALCGPREERTLKDGSILAKLGYTSEMVSKL